MEKELIGLVWYEDETGAHSLAVAPPFEKLNQDDKIIVCGEVVTVVDARDIWNTDEAFEFLAPFITRLDLDVEPFQKVEAKLTFTKMEYKEEKNELG